MREQDLNLRRALIHQTDSSVLLKGARSNPVLVDGTHTWEPSESSVTQHAAKGAGGSHRRALLPNVEVAAVERAMGSPVTAVLVDCEGCAASVLGHARLMRRVEVVLLEEDDPRHTNYTHWHAELERMGFERVWDAQDTFCRADPPSCGTRHSGWELSTRAAREHSRTAASPTTPSTEPVDRLRDRCQAYRARMGYSEEQLRCASG